LEQLRADLKHQREEAQLKQTETEGIRKELAQRQETLGKTQDQVSEREKALDERERALKDAEEKLAAEHEQFDDAHDGDAAVLESARRQLEQTTAELEEERAEIARRLKEISAREAELKQQQRAIALGDGYSQAAFGPPTADSASSHAAIASFWASFDFANTTERPVDRSTGSAPSPQVGALEQKARLHEAAHADIGQKASIGTEAGASTDSGEPVVDQAGALRAALEAARAEVEDAQDEPPHETHMPVEQPAPEAREANNPLIFTGKTSKPEQSEPPLGSEAELEASLDPETRRKIKMLRRLNPGKPLQELLEQISATKTPAAQKKAKRKWFGMS
jgi:hypothetical protein